MARRVPSRSISKHDSILQDPRFLKEKRHRRSCRLSHGLTQELRKSSLKIRKSGQRRSVIPFMPNRSFSLWSIVKEFIGMDISTISMPVSACEPLTVLQRLTEDLQYAYLLHAAAKSEDKTKELAYVAAYSVSSYSITQHREKKPFDPLVGETYECDRTEDLGWRSIAEQIQRHPPVSAFHCEGNGWTLWQNFIMLSKFKGKYLSVTPMGTVHLTFKNSDSHYTWTKVNCNVHNILMGKTWMEHFGEVEIVNHTNGEKCHLMYKPYTFFAREYARQVTGTIFDANGQEKYKLDGFWNSSMEGRSIAGRKKNEILWKCLPQPPNSETMYNFSKLAIELNELEEGVAPTDSRFRSDVRLMELGDWDEADRERVRLVQMQRSSASSDADHKPLWFSSDKDSVTGQTCYVYNGEYWKTKATGNWDVCPNLF